MESLKESIRQVGPLLGRLDVLFVDDGDELLTPLAHALAKHSKSFIVSDARNALANIEKLDPDCVIFNLDAEGADTQLLSRIRSKNRDIPVVVASEKHDKKKLLDLINLSVSAFIQKPLDNRKLMTALKSVGRILRRRKESKIQAEFILTLLDINPSYLALVGKKGLEYLNHSFKNFLDVASVEEFIKKNRGIVSLIVNKDRLLTSDDELGSWVIQKSGNEGLALQMKLPDSSSLFSFLLTAVPVTKSENNYLLTFTDITSIEKEKEHYQLLAEYDALTKIFNRSKLNKMMDAEITRVLRYGQRLSMLMVDIDYFKNVNDSYGHLVGDMVLSEMAKLFQDHTRRSDILGRYGGEEFIILMPSTSIESAADIAERLRMDIGAHEFLQVGCITVSIGVTEYVRGEHIESFIKRVDDALYAAKNKGRNRVEIIFTNTENSNQA